MKAVGMVTIGTSAQDRLCWPFLALLGFVFLLAWRPVTPLDLEQCGSPLGMESGAIRDSEISASSAYDSGSVGPQHARLRVDKNGGAWCPRQMVSADVKEYLEIDLKNMHIVTGSRTQGRFGNGQGQEYAENYKIDYWRPGFTKWTRWKNRSNKELLTGNTNTYTVVEQKLDPPVLATKIRFLPYSEHVRTVCMRVEVLGCRWHGIIRGNITDEEIEDLIPPTDTGKEYPLQRDEVQTTLSKINHNVIAPSPNEKPQESKHYIGPVIGVLSVVIIILVAAIIFIVYRNQRMKATPIHSALPVSDMRNDSKVTMEECDKSALYQPEPCRLNMYTSTGRECMETHPASPDYTDVPDIMCQEYAIPHHTALDPSLPVFAIGPQTPIRPPPPLHNFLPKPPPVPPPPEQYYAAAEICNSGPALPPPPVLSPPGKISSLFMLPLCPDLEDSSGHEDEEVDIVEFPREQLRPIDDFGQNHFGSIHLCEVQRLPAPGDANGPKLASVNTLQLEELSADFVRELRALARLHDTNIARLLGGSAEANPLYAVREFGEFGDLCQFLQDHVAETTTPRPPTARTLSYGCLIYMATQIASGMKYLESMNYVHKDLATRNCVVGPAYCVQVTDLGPGRALYAADYCRLARAHPEPLRWMAWESALLGNFSIKADVWSFAVTLWEVLTFAREQPFEEYTDEKVMENLAHFYQDDGKHMLLTVPINCPKEIFDLMCECWQRNESDRPNFREIHLFLQRKNLGYKPEMN